MPALNFKKQFPELILAGKKPFTLRAPRKDGRNPKVGDTLYLFTGMRTKSCDQFATELCRFTCDAFVTNGGIYIPELLGSDDATLSFRAESTFARLDGFDNIVAFYKFHLAGDAGAKDLKLIAWIKREELLKRINK